MPFTVIQLSSGTITIKSSHFFADIAARDAYFVSFPAERILDVIISVGSGYEQWNSSLWVDITAIVRGPVGIGVPEGGAASEVLAKASTADYDTE
jgi:hypothetical protein